MASDDDLGGVPQAPDRFEDRELARGVARHLLGEVRAQRRQGTLLDGVRLATALGLSVAEMERASGYSRPSIHAARARLVEYMAQPGIAPVADRSTLVREALALLVAAGGEVSTGELARRLQRPEPVLRVAVGILAEQGLSDAREFERPGEIVAKATRKGREVLARLSEDLYLTGVGRDGFAVYLAVEEGEVHAISAGAREIVGNGGYAMIPPGTAGHITQHELALRVQSPSSRMARETAEQLWADIRARVGLLPAQPRVMDLRPPAALPGAESGVLDAFADALLATGASTVDVEAVMRARLSYRGDDDERTLAGRCLTAALRAVRRVFDNQGEPRPITDAEAAFSELVHLEPIKAGPKKPVKDLAIQALSLAAERLGPFPGGGIRTGPGPLGEVRPSNAELAKMAQLAGETLAAALGHTQDLDPAAELAHIAHRA